MVLCQLEEEDVTSAVYNRAKLRLAKLRSNLATLVSSHQARFQEEEKKKLVLPQDIKNFFDSSDSQEATRVLNSKEWWTLSFRDVNLVRNYLVTKLIIKNSLRPCALYRLSHEAFTKKNLGAADPDTSMYEVPLFFDKTVATQGHASYLHLTGNNFN